MAKRFKENNKYLSDKEKIKSHKMKKMMAALCSSVIIATAAVSTAMMSVGAESAIYASTTDYLNLRSGAGMNYSVIKVIPEKETVTVIDKSNKNWLQVKTSDGKTGYCSADYLDIVTDAKTTDYLNLRTGAGTNYSIIKTLNPNVTVDIIRFYGSSWANIRLSDGTKGYVCTDYVDYVTKGKTPDTTEKDTVTISQTSCSLTVGDSKTLTAKTSSGGSTKWTSSDSKIVSVSNGTLKALKEGTATVTVTDSKTNITASCKVTVSKAAEKVTLSETNCTLNIGSDKTLTAKSSANGTIEWTTSDSSIATVSSNGKITAKKSGTVTITATDKTSKAKATCKVTVVQNTYNSIKLSDTSRILETGNKFTLKATTDPTGGKVYFKSNNSSIAKVDDNGQVTAMAVGTATITAYDATNTITKTCSVTVKDKDSITISKTSASVNTGSSITLTAKSSNSSAIVWTSNNTSIASVNNGVVSGLKPGTATITASNAAGTVKSTCTITVNQVSSSGVNISRASATITAGKTIYLKGYSSSSASWGTSDSSIATVSEGFVYTKKAGKVAVTYKDNSGHTAVCVLTVYDSAPVKFAYSSPNSATLNSDVTLVAITDKSRSKVRFEINADGKKTIIDATDKTEDGNTYVWKAKYKVTSSGTFSVTTFACKDGAWKTCDDGNTDIYVSNKSSSSTTGLEKLRASDDVIKFIGNKEGFVSSVTYDTLANNIPTIGYGYVVNEGKTFYNKMTKNEAYALLVDTVNNDVFTRDVNNMLINNSIKFNQQQFDSLVTFSYNLGTGWTYSSDLKDILMNSITTTSDDSAMTGTVNTTSGLNLRSEPTTSSSIITTLLYNEKVTIVDSKKYNNVWYKVKTNNGKVGYCSSTYLNVSTTGKAERNLNYVNKNALIKEMLAYHHSGGNCYYGLLYRRVDELEMFLYNDYNDDGRSNKHNFPSPYCISF